MLHPPGELPPTLERAIDAPTRDCTLTEDMVSGLTFEFIWQSVRPSRFEVSLNRCQ